MIVVPNQGIFIVASSSSASLTSRNFIEARATRKVSGGILIKGGRSGTVEVSAFLGDSRGRSTFGSRNLTSELQGSRTRFGMGVA